MSDANGRAWQKRQGICSVGSFAEIGRRGSRRLSPRRRATTMKRGDRIFPRKVRDVNGEERAPKALNPTIALFFRAAFVHLTMLQSTPACTVLRPPFFSPPSVVVLLSFIAPPFVSLSLSLSIRIDVSLFFPPRASPFLSRFFQALPLERRAILSHPALFTPAIYPSDNKRRLPSPSRNRRRSAQCAMHFCD